MWNARSVVAAGSILAAFAVLIGLGTWQMARRAEKHALIARVEAQRAAPPVELPARIDDPAALDQRRVTVHGRYLHGRELRLINRVRNGVAGIHVITPLVRDDGPTVLIDRGWAPATWGRDDSRLTSLPSGRVRITGIARVPPPPGAFTPANDPAKGVWFFVDLPAMAAARNLETFAPVLVVAETDADGHWDVPKPEGGSPEIKDNHLHYALTWYSLALALAAVVVIAVRRRAVPRP